MFANPEGIHMSDKSPSWTSPGSGGPDTAIRGDLERKASRLVGHGLEPDFWAGT
jgi:hypothetical protein